MKHVALTSLPYKQIKIKDGDLLDTLRRTIYEYQRDTGKDPAGLALGPENYLALRYLVNDAKSFGSIRWNQSGNLTEFMGIPIHIQRRPGIEVLIDESMVGYFARGVIK